MHFSSNFVIGYDAKESYLKMTMQTIAEVKFSGRSLYHIVCHVFLVMEAFNSYKFYLKEVPL